VRKKLKQQIIKTLDGSTTIHLPDWDENYHSKHGAIQEAQHVFIKNGFQLFDEKPLSILEIGFVTGLNAYITYLKAKKSNQIIDYVGVEAYPVEADVIDLMNYTNELHSDSDSLIYDSMHKAQWNQKTAISDTFSLTKRKQFFEDIDDFETFDLIYFDAFGYRVQPELWSTEIFRKMFHALKKEGILVTYAARGVIKRSMMEVGFSVEKLEGPPGKREMTRARKN
jgi:tRNA U34 5-methylaminomethyl-2-thiouridine-forming methyltransferase MnmC